MKILIGLFFVLVFTFAVNAQTVKTKDGIRLQEVEKTIVTVKKEIENAETEKAQLLVKYQREHPEVQEAIVRLNKLNESLAILNLERKDLLTKQLVRTLPNNDIGLLKLIVMQNERIIELLEKLSNHYLEVMKITGHTQLKTFLRYLNITPETAKKVAGRLNDYLDQSAPQSIESNSVN